MAHFRVINCLLLLCFFAVARSDFAADRAECASQLVGLSPCLTYAGGSGKAPTPDCCKGLQEVVAQSFKCLCVLVKDRDEPALGFKFNVTRALFLPSMCQVPANALPKFHPYF
ncbi:Protein YLS3 [Ananas comosus]|uniref:Protein YLS3 n=1 Tax=Ananas comosus TaxID=4615 RepID=A0A199VYP9_ANACO|nr:Protein YLS3 [Ananas comosus]